jgi:hypothetical protein
MAIWQPQIACRYGFYDRLHEQSKSSMRRAPMSPALHGEFSNLLNLFALDETYHPNRTALGRSQMTAIARVLSRRLPASPSDIETLKTIGMFCGVGLLVSLMLASYGLDLSPGFF